MLVLTRKPGQKIQVGSTVVTVLSVRGNRVQIGIEAPGGVRIARVELHAAEKAAASECREPVCS